MQKKIQTVLKRLLQLHPKSIDLSLNRIKRLLKDLKNPQKKIENAIQVVGTNGKNSTIQAMRSILDEAKIKINIYTSPHIQRINESYIREVDLRYCLSPRKIA